MLDIVRLVAEQRSVEDDRVELKAQWPTDHYKAARQIAGLANSSRGDDVLWIVGVDEKTGVVDSLDAVEFSNWWAQVARYFDELAPDPQFLNIPVGDGRQVTALLFDTSRAPYLVNVPGGGRVEREVPWRSGNSTRTAHRRELLASVVSQARVPDIELVSGRCWVSEVDPYSGTGGEDDPTHEIRIEATAFLSATTEVMLPQHRQRWSVLVDGSEPVPIFASVRGPYRFEGSNGHGGPGRTHAGIIDVLENSGLLVHRSGEVAISGHAYLRGDEVRRFAMAPWIDLLVTLPIDRTELSCELRSRFKHIPNSGDPRDSDTGRARELARFEAMDDGHP